MSISWNNESKVLPVQNCQQDLLESLLVDIIECKSKKETITSKEIKISLKEIGITDEDSVNTIIKLRTSYPKVIANKRVFKAYINALHRLDMQYKIKNLLIHMATYRQITAKEALDLGRSKLDNSLYKALSRSIKKLSN